MSTDEGMTTELDRRAMEFLHGARSLRGLAPGAEERIERSVEGFRMGKRRPRRFVLATAAATIALVAGGAFALAHVGWRDLPVIGKLGRPGRLGVPRETAAPPAPSSPVSQPDLPAVHEVSAPVVVPEPGDVGAPASAMKRSGRWERKRNSTIKARDSVLSEARSFAEAIERWHRQHDPAGALTALDAHERRFPEGSLTTEAHLLRAEILLGQGRERESLHLLDRVKLDGSPRSRELFTVRGELRVKAGRCSEARADLLEVVRGGAEDDLAKRATQALVHCP